METSWTRKKKIHYFGGQPFSKTQKFCNNVASLWVYDYFNCGSHARSVWNLFGKCGTETCKHNSSRAFSFSILYKEYVSIWLNYLCLCVCVCVCAHTCWWCYALHSTFPSHVCPIYLLHCLRQWCWGLSWNYLLCLLYTVAVLLGLHLVWLRTWDLSSWMGLWYEAENIPYCFCATLTENLFIYLYTVWNDSNKLKLYSQRYYV